MSNWSGKCAAKYHSWDFLYRPETFSMLSWNYNSCADILTITEEHPSDLRYGDGEAVTISPKTLYLDPAHAKALYLTLRHWIQVYYGELEITALDTKGEER